MTWTTPADLRAQARKWWDQGQLLACLAGAEPMFPRRMVFKGPTSSQLSEQFGPVRDWMTHLAQEAKHYRVVYRSIHHRILGCNDVPVQIWIDSLEDALELAGRRREAERFKSLVATTERRQPKLTAWLRKRPLRALDLVDAWPRLLDIVAWMESHPRPGLYLRQVDIAGVHSKFIEAHRAVLAELFDRVLPQDLIAAATPGLTGFAQRYGFRDKPLRLRFRSLDPHFALLTSGTDQDLTVTHDTFARLVLPVDKVFITENEINFLAFPALPRSLVIFGAGYGFENLAEADWLHQRAVYYWGDIDTHGFAILDQLRTHFPRTVSLLMDRATLLAHRIYWETEPRPETRDLPCLTTDETDLYDDLRLNRLGRQVRLEQERIGYDWVVKTLWRL